MKLLVIFKILLIAISILFISSCNKPEIQIDINGSFETQSENNTEVDGWYATRVPETKEYYKFNWDNNISHSGDYSVSIFIDGNHPNKKIVYNWNRFVKGLKTKENYVLQGWIKTKNLDGTAFIVLQCLKWETKEIIEFFTTTKEYTVTGTSDWTFVKTSFEVPEEADLVRILAGIGAPDNGGAKTWFDDIQIVQ